MNVASSFRALPRAVRRLGREVLTSTGLLRPARSLIWRARSRGLMPWRPLVPEQSFSDTMKRAVELLMRRGHVFGDYLEFGVSRGTSMACAYRVLRDVDLASVRLIGFDSFEGLPPEAADQGWEPRQYRSSLEATRAYLRAHGVDDERVTLVAGWFRDTCTAETTRRLSLEKASLVMIDCDIYSASKEALEFCAPLIRDEAVLIFDDWGYVESRGIRGQKEAFAEFLQSNPHLSATAITPTYIPQARVFHVRSSTVAGDTAGIA